MLSNQNERVLKALFNIELVNENRKDKIDQKESLWKGECYVFDNRISLKHKLKQGSYSMCSGCRKPISKQDKKSNMYEEGVSCPNCLEKLTDSQKARFRMRQKQIVLAKKAGKKHIFQKDSCDLDTCYYMGCNGVAFRLVIYWDFFLILQYSFWGLALWIRGIHATFDDYGARLVSNNSTVIQVKH